MYRIPPATTGGIGSKIPPSVLRLFIGERSQRRTSGRKYGSFRNDDAFVDENEKTTRERHIGNKVVEIKTS